MGPLTGMDKNAARQCHDNEYDVNQHGGNEPVLSGLGYWNRKGLGRGYHEIDASAQVVIQLNHWYTGSS